MPRRRSIPIVKQPLRNPSDKDRADLTRRVLAALNPNTPHYTRSAAKAAASPPSLRAVAGQIEENREAVRRAAKRSSSSFIPPKAPGRPRLLTTSEESALVSYVIWWERSGFAAEKSQIEETALQFLHSRGIEKDHMSHSWYPDFRERHPELGKTFLKGVDKTRKAFEVSDIKDIDKFFSNLKEIIYDHGIGPSETWNEDECGIRIGTLRERIQVLVVRTTRSQRFEVPDPSNRESCTQIGCANAIGDSIPPWLIFKALAMTSWANMDAIPRMRIAHSDTGFSNQLITFEWLHHFNAFSWLASAKASRKGVTLTEWFGCDEWLRDVTSPNITLTAPPAIRNDEDRIYRLLVIDGFSGHLGFDSIQYCIQFDIIICVLPSHSTHLTQPLDVGVFQPLKNSHQKELRKSIREGNIMFSREDFAAAFAKIYRDGFKRHNIMSGFEKAGIWPTSSKPVIDRVIAKHRKERKAIHPSVLKMLPSETRFQDAQDQIERIYRRYQEVMSSPTLEAIANIRNVVTEAGLLYREREAVASHRLNRIEKYGKRRRAGHRVRPSGDFVTSVGFPEIRAQHEASVAAAEAKEQRSQLRSSRSLILQEIRTLKAAWLQELQSRGTSYLPRLTWNQWLEETGQLDRYNNLEANRKRHNDSLSQQPKKSLSEAQEEARRAARPIIAMDQSAWPDDDDDVEFTLTGPLQEEENDEDDEAALIGFGDISGDEIPDITTPPGITSSPPPSSLDLLENADDDNITTPQLPDPMPTVRRYDGIKKMLKEFRDEQATKRAEATHRQQGPDQQPISGPRKRRRN